MTADLHTEQLHARILDVADWLEALEVPLPWLKCVFRPVIVTVSIRMVGITISLAGMAMR